jgi:hypothetical protein
MYGGRIWLSSAHLASIILNTINLQTILYKRKAETVENGRSQREYTHRRVVDWIWLSAEKVLGPLAPLAIVSLMLVLAIRGVLSLLSAVGVRTARETDAFGAEAAVLVLAMIVVPLLIRIARVLEEIARRME